MAWRPRFDPAKVNPDGPIRDRRGMTQTPVLAIVLAAGKGTRMKSDIAEGDARASPARRLLVHVLSAAKGRSRSKRSAWSSGPAWTRLRASPAELDPGLPVFVQAEQRGTADAVKAAQDAFAGFAGPVIILYGDTPLLAPGDDRPLRAALAEGADLVVIGFEAEDPTGYGRLLLDERGTLDRHPRGEGRERRGARDQTLQFGDHGLSQRQDAHRPSCPHRQRQRQEASSISPMRWRSPAPTGSTRACCAANADEVLGVNSRAELAQAEAAMQQRLRDKAMAEGATLVAPETVFLSHDTRIGKDVIIEPNVVFGPGVVVEDGATIHSFCHFVDAHIGPNAEVGPFARLRPGAELGPNTKVGNFVEIKKSRDRRRRQGQPPHLYRRYQRRRARQYRRRHHHLQL